MRLIKDSSHESASRREASRGGAGVGVRGRARWWVALGLMAGLALLFTSTTTGSNVVDLLPNLQALPAEDIHLTETGDGRLVLRFSTTSWNNGQGPFILHADAADVENQRQAVFQRIERSDGSTREVKIGTFVWDGRHRHLHFNDYAEYILTPLVAPEGAQRQGFKVAFCIVDSERVDPSLDGAPKRSIYRSCNPELQGLSVGWGDLYDFTLPGQEIDVTDLAARGASGQYLLTLVIDPTNVVVEENDTPKANSKDNTSSVWIYLDFENNTARILGVFDETQLNKQEQQKVPPAKG